MAPIVIDRTTGSIISAPELTATQRDTLWGELIRAYVHKHPEVFDEEEAPK